MYIDNSSPRIPPLSMRTPPTGTNEDTGQASSPIFSGNQEPSTSPAAKADAITGISGVKLSSEMMDQLIASAQQTDPTNTAPAKYNGILSAPERHGLDRLANDNNYAQMRSESIGAAPDLIRIDASQMPKNGGDPAYAKAFYERIDNLQQKTSEVSDKRLAFYDSQVAQGLSHAQVLANVMEFNANLSQDYWDSLNIGFDKSNQTVAHFQASHDYLQHAIDTAKLQKTTA
ncbi:MAG: hypothetical protein JKY92_01290 [Magnetovibrio sp.]|nr:hypothetical protein [Magnetovibrio sp.]